MVSRRWPLKPGAPFQRTAFFLTARLEALLTLADRVLLRTMAI
jgi:hypothetical protein